MLPGYQLWQVGQHEINFQSRERSVAFEKCGGNVSDHFDGFMSFSWILRGKYAHVTNFQSRLETAIL